MDRKKILIVIGTRPEAIKMAPLIKKLKAEHSLFETKICLTAQHRKLLDEVLNFFGITPDYDLNVMLPGQHLSGVSAKILTLLTPVFEKFKPDFAFVHGDTTTSFMAALTAFYADSKIVHIEAGLRTHTMDAPFPEEANRQLTARLASIHCAPTELSRANLIREGIDATQVFVTGNTVIDALFLGLENLERTDWSDKRILMPKSKIILVTAHRRENFGEGIRRICNALKKIARQHPQVTLVYPVHPNPNILKPVHELLAEIPNVLLTDPLNYPDFIRLIKHSHLILTDSGGVQEEAPSLGKPVLVLREHTERTEALQAGTVKLVGTDEGVIVDEVDKLLNDAVYYKIQSHTQNPYGDGTASAKILEIIKHYGT